MLLTDIILYFTISTLVGFCTARDPDYFEEKYDPEKNCKHEQKLVQLEKEMATKKTVCIRINVKVKDIAPYICKASLRNKLSGTCKARSRVKVTENYMYCYDRGTINCCFERYECVKSDGGKDKLKQITQDLDDYLKYGLKVYPELYASKHEYRICKSANEPNGTELCNKACEDEEKGKFAMECNKNPKSNFKCCAVRQNINCDVCGICCLLPVCTTKGITEEGNTVKFNVNTTLTPVIDAHKKAKEIREHLKIIKQFHEKSTSSYYNPEKQQFCLKTDQNDKKKSYDEPSYNMTAYRAFTKKGKVDVPTFTLPEESEKYHPESRKKFASSKGAKYWSHTFGFDKCYKLKKKGTKSSMRCFRKCRRLEKTKFAKKCNKKYDSVYKCCVQMVQVKHVEDRQRKVMKKLWKDKLISKPLQELCSGTKCSLCCISSLCSERGPDGNIVNDFAIKSNKPIHILWKESQRYGKCRAHYGTESVKFNMTVHKQAYTKDMLCAVPAYTMKGDKQIPATNKKIMINKYCSKKRGKTKNHSRKEKEKTQSNEGRRRKKKKKGKKRRNGKSKKKKDF